MAQCAQPAPQEDLPAFLFFIMYRTISATTAAKTTIVKIVPQLFKSQVIIIPPFRHFRFLYPEPLFGTRDIINYTYFAIFYLELTFTEVVNVSDSLYGLKSI